VPGLPPLGPAWTPSPISTPDGQLNPTWSCATPSSNLIFVQASGCFLPVRGGTFLMGAQATQPSAPGYEPHAAADEGPPHKVTVSSFWLQQDEVTALAYRYCVAAGACSLDDIIPPGKMNAVTNAEMVGLPANGVSWRGAERYCSWIGASLPTEAEWEFAARGPDSLPWPWGSDAWCGVSGPAPGVPPAPTEPDWACQGESFIANERIALRGPFRHRALVGNLWEWVADWYDPRAYTSSPTTDPAGPKSGKNRVQRGGSWMTTLLWDRRPSARSQAPAEQKLPDVGFRCAWRGPVP
jgi:formylglycine-generating enzyme required for sulfatase activity